MTRKKSIKNKIASFFGEYVFIKIESANLEHQITSNLINQHKIITGERKFIDHHSHKQANSTTIKHVN
jgi:hypothetical protein